jgi:hypothetical protein
LTDQVDTAPAARLGNLLEVVVGHIQGHHSTKILEGVRKSSKTIVREIQLLELITAPVNIVRKTWVNGGGGGLGREREREREKERERGREGGSKGGRKRGRQREESISYWSYVQ